MTAITYAAFATAVVPLFVVPGWFWLRRLGVSPLVAIYAGFGVTAAVAAAIVALGVLLPWSVRATAAGGAALMAVTAAWCARTAPRPLLPPRADLAGMAVFVIAFIGLACYIAVPSHPSGVWDPASGSIGPERIETPRWPSQPVDNVLPYRTGQIALHKLGGEQLRDRFAVGWWMSDRTPLTGLAFAFAASTLGVHVPRDDPTLRPTSEVTMTLKDRYGFWAYNLVALLFNSAIVLGAYLLARVWKGPTVAAASALTVTLLPGVFLHDIYTWPKQAVAYFVLAAAAAAIDRRPLLAGAFATLGYLTHPAAAIWVPPLLLLTLAHAGGRQLAYRAAARFAAGAVALVLPWLYFTSQVIGGASRLVYWPFGYILQDRTDPLGELDAAWDALTSRGVLENLWSRLQGTTISLIPYQLVNGAGQAVSRLELGRLWVGAHGGAVWTMVGLALFVAVVFHTARTWQEQRRVMLLFVLPAIVLAILAAGFNDPGNAFARQSMFPLLGVLAVLAGEMLLRIRPAVAMVLIVVTAAELVSIAWVVLYRPFNISLGPQIAFTSAAVLAQLALVAALVALVVKREGRDGQLVSFSRT